MAIDANVAYVELKEDNSGILHLCDRIPNNSRGQDRLYFDDAPYEITCLNGLSIWGGSSEVMLGNNKIADRLGYSKIKFINAKDLFIAVSAYHHNKRSN